MKKLQFFLFLLAMVAVISVLSALTPVPLDGVANNDEAPSVQSSD